MLGKVDVETETIPVNEMSDKELKKFLQKNGLSLKLNEARRIVSLIGRNPTLTEMHIFNIEWSEHSSYKSSKKILKKLPTKSPKVILGPIEDSGIVELCKIGNDRYGIVISHESHNHPSQVVPYEGAATGIGGILRDVLCMGAHILATADPLRFGDPYGKFKERTRYIANAVIDGIAGYGNAVGIPNLAGDVYFNESFDDNCLVNVVCIGLVKEKDIIHSISPKNSEGYDIILIGKATDNSGFGGASFASLILDEEDEEGNKASVQVPDPFLKNVLIRATESVFKKAREKRIKLGFKDLGAGGIMCASSEMCSLGNVGADINLDEVHVSMKDLPSYIIACSETQERLMWISPPEFTETILKVYNEDFALPEIAELAQAKVIGKVTKEKDYVLRYKGKVVCNVPVNVVTSGISYDRKVEKRKRNFQEPNLKEPKDYNETFLKILRHPNVANKALVYNHYDKEVQGNTIIRSGEADAGVIAPIFNAKVGISLSTDSNPRYCRISPYLGAVNAVAEAMRNVSAVGAIPTCLTDCLCFGNPEKPEVFYDFCQSVEGIADAAKNISYYKTNYPVPVVSGNVSFYNESSQGKAVFPSPIIACVGVLNDYSKAITMKLKEEGSILFMVGERRDELGGSVYYEINNELGKNVPKIDFKKERNMIYAIIDSINERLLLSCHDISDGGLGTCLAEMVLGGEADGKIGAKINLDFSQLRTDKLLFSESSGFVFEVNKNKVSKVKKIFENYSLELIELGKTIKDEKLIVEKNEKIVLNSKIEKLKESWTSGFMEAIK
jgi:phosphoribosylformylglycinamidine synthase